MFKPYRSSDVNFNQFTKINELWATAYLNSKEDALVLGEPIMIEFLGWGSSPIVWWSDLSKEEQSLLLLTLPFEDKILLLKKGKGKKVKEHLLNHLEFQL